MSVLFNDGASCYFRLIKLFCSCIVSAGRFSLFFVPEPGAIMDPELIKKVAELAEPVVMQEDLFLVGVEEKGGDVTELWIYVDSANGGVNLDACSRISRELDILLDAYDLITTRYRLNVSSPGLSRPLTDRRQYGKNVDRLIRVRFRDGESYQRLEGTLKRVTEEGIEMLTDQDLRRILFEDILETKVIPQL